MMRRIVGLMLAGSLVLAAAACGEDEAASGEYLDALTGSLLGAEDGEPLASDEGEARCAAEEITDGVGQERLEEAGLTLESLRSPTLTKTGLDLTDEEALLIADAVIVCTDAGALFAAEIVASSELPPADAECVGERIAGSSALRELLAVALQQGAKAVMTTDGAGRVLDVMAECGTLGNLFAEVFASSGMPLDEAQTKCVNDAIAADQGARALFLRSFSGDEPTDEEYQQALLPAVAKCVPLDSLG